MDLKKEQIEITIKMSAHEWCRLMFMAEHVGEEAHDMGDDDEPWFTEEWWDGFADMIQKKLKEHEITTCDMHAYDEDKPEKKPNPPREKRQPIQLFNSVVVDDKG